MLGIFRIPGMIQKMPEASFLLAQRASALRAGSEDWKAAGGGKCPGIGLTCVAADKLGDD